MSEDPGVDTDLRDRYDVVIVGAGLAGLALARHLLLKTDKSVLLLDKRSTPSARGQKVGESLVQLAGYYFSKVLELEEHLLTRHYLKYNLRFQWPTSGLANRAIEDYSASYSRFLSNIATFQLDRNLLEAHLLEVNRANPRCTFLGGVQDTAVALSEAGDHVVTTAGRRVGGRWVVDASGRGAVLRRQLSLSAGNPIRHGATWCWVDGLVNIEQLTSRSPDQVRVDPRKRRQGNFPRFLATNHFCGEGQWFWVIPLHGKTSLGLVFDRSVVDASQVATPEQMIAYACREWPLFARDLPQRRILSHGRLPDFSYDATETISAGRWALTGEAGRFSDPLYSPGSDLISIYNTLIVDAIRHDEAGDLEQRCRMHETLMRAVYQAYVPSYAVSYDCLGDQEAFSLKYAWELAVYFGFYVMPFLSDLFADPAFERTFLVKFASLGRINQGLQHLLSGYYRWKRLHRPKPLAPVDVELYDIGCLRDAEKLFYQVAVSPDEAIDVLDHHLDRLKEFARYIIAHVHASVIGDGRVLLNGPFVAGLRLQHVVFDEAAMRAAYAPFAGATEQYRWSLNPSALSGFLPDDSLARASA